MRSLGYSVAFFLALGAAPALAQSAPSDEAVKPNGGVEQKVGLTPAQKNAIYNAVFGKPVKPVPAPLIAAVGAPVPQSAELNALPDEAVAAASSGNAAAVALKYAMVDRDVVVVDPVNMSVVEVIRDGGRP